MDSVLAMIVAGTESCYKTGLKCAEQSRSLLQGVPADVQSDVFRICSRVCVGDPQ